MTNSLRFGILFLMMMYLSNLNAKTIANIPEASGLAYVSQTNTLFVVADEGTIYELTKKGKIVRKKYLGNYDLEGITYDTKQDILLLVEEKNKSILLVDTKNLEVQKEVKIKRKFENIKLLKKSKKRGIEAIAIDTNGDIYLSNQSQITYKKKLKEDASVIFKIGSLEYKKSKIIKVFNHGYVDISGLTFYDGYLYMISDKENLLIKYDIKTNKTNKTIKLPKSAQEGVSFDEKYVYIADDNGRILRYKKDKLGI